MPRYKSSANVYESETAEGLRKRYGSHSSTRFSYVGHYDSPGCTPISAIAEYKQMKEYKL